MHLTTIIMCIILIYTQSEGLNYSCTLYMAATHALLLTQKAHG